MAENELLTITLSAQTSARLREKMAARGYSDPEQVIEDALSALEPEDRELELWLRGEVVPVCEEVDRDPSQVLTFEESGRALEAEYARFLKAS